MNLFCSMLNTVYSAKYSTLLCAWINYWNRLLNELRKRTKTLQNQLQYFLCLYVRMTNQCHKYRMFCREWRNHESIWIARRWRVRSYNCRWKQFVDTCWSRRNFVWTTIDESKSTLFRIKILGEHWESAVPKSSTIQFY